MSRLVPTVQTTPTLKEFAIAALQVVPTLSKEACGVLWAQHAIETTNGAHCYGWNLGNIKHSHNDGFDYHALKGVFEYVHGHPVPIPPTSPGAWFKDFPTLDAGMSFHIHFLSAGRYQTTWTFILAGDAAGFARELGRCGYYTAPPAGYIAGCQAKMKMWLASGAYEQASAELFPVPVPPMDVVHSIPDLPPAEGENASPDLPEGETIGEEPE
jgi:hypothetical protein